MTKFDERLWETVSGVPTEMHVANLRSIYSYAEDCGYGTEACALREDALNSVTNEQGNGN